MAPRFSAAPPDFRTAAAKFVVVALHDSAVLDRPLKELDDQLGGSIQRALDSREFRGARDEQLYLTSSDGTRVLLVGTGTPGDRSIGLRRAASVGTRQARKLGVGTVAFYGGDISSREIEAVVVGIAAAAWSYSELKLPVPEKEKRAEIQEAIVLTSDLSADSAIRNGEAIGAGHSLARLLAMMPGNLCTPDYLASVASEIANRFGMGLTILGRAEMQAQGMGSFLAVAQGTPQDPKLVAMEYKGGKQGDAPVVLVGKGLCFDSGGISIKPAQSMEDMKFDMCGAAGVLGAMEVIAQLQLKINVVGIFGATTNMPSGTAMNPGDVVVSHFGKSIEIINTDAEGRLVLADLLSFARRFNPAVVIDAATLTGACVVALGHSATGVFGTDEALINEVLAAGKRAGEPGWSLPLWDEYRDLIKSDVADMKNSGGRAAGSISAAMFLKEFVEGFPWVHLDIAGTAYSETDLVAIPKGPTGVPVGTFVEFVRARASR
ncbi:MAG: leucyl aminopeptidase [Gemmatimonadaceae bacterium]|nr:leucyl aminopeptidase [Gemmatimonadaceae bacterium]